jgi:hypothetical protein
MTSATPVVCPRCSEPFECGVDTGTCWCKSAPLSDATRSAFAEYYEGCLCPTCLGVLESGRPPVPSVREFLTSQLKLMRKRKGT